MVKLSYWLVTLQTDNIFWQYICRTIKISIPFGPLTPALGNSSKGEKTVCINMFTVEL